MKNHFAFILIAIILGMRFSSCDSDDHVVPVATKTVVHIAQVNGYSSLAAALQKAGLVDDLQAAGVNSNTIYGVIHVIDAVLLPN